jgi:hypothetical protein
MLHVAPMRCVCFAWSWCVQTGNGMQVGTLGLGRYRLEVNNRESIDMHPQLFIWAFELTTKLLCSQEPWQVATGTNWSRTLQFTGAA